MLRNTTILFLMAVLLLSSCTRPTKTYIPTILPTTLSTANAAVIAEGTLTETATATKIAATATATELPNTQPAAILPTATSHPAAEATEYQAFTVNSTVDGLLLRTGPGTLFDAWRMLGPSDELMVNGTIAGNEWTMVTTTDGLDGWVFNKLLTSPADLTHLPLLNVEAQTVVGHVRDAAGNPVSGIGFEITDGTFSLVVVSDQHGDFYWYSPVGTTGKWTITQTAIDCTSNVWATSACDQMLPGFVGEAEPKSLTVDLPMSGEVGSFLYK